MLLALILLVPILGGSSVVPTLGTSTPSGNTSFLEEEEEEEVCDDDNDKERWGGLVISRVCYGR